MENPRGLRRRHRADRIARRLAEPYCLPMPATDHPPFTIGQHAIAPGDARQITLPLTIMANGIEAALGIEVIHGKRPGPTIFVSGSVHGDEIIGTAIVQRLREAIEPHSLAGTVLLVPVVNIFGFLTQSRYLPDRRDLNRSFPGSANGSLAAQLAHLFFGQVIARCQLGIDIHSAAVHRYNLPQIRIAEDNPRLVELAMAFGAPVIIESPLRDGSMRALAQESGVDMLLLEAGEALRFDRLSIETGVNGIRQVLAYLGMVEAPEGTPGLAVPTRANRTTWVRAPRGGIMLRRCEAGDPVKQGDLLATVSDLTGQGMQPVPSPVDGIVIGLATLPVVHQGDALFHIAQIAHPEKAGQAIDSITEAILASQPEGPGLPQLDEDELI